jgi:hypothetical protein
MQNTWIFAWSHVRVLCFIIYFAKLQGTHYAQRGCLDDQRLDEFYRTESTQSWTIRHTIPDKSADAQKKKKTRETPASGLSMLWPGFETGISRNRSVGP